MNVRQTQGLNSGKRSDANTNVIVEKYRTKLASMLRSGEQEFTFEIADTAVHRLSHLSREIEPITKLLCHALGRRFDRMNVSIVGQDGGKNTDTKVKYRFHVVLG